MAREKKAIIKKLNEISFKGKASSIAFALLTLTLTIIVFSGLLFLQDIFTEEIIYQNVIVAKSDIPENEIITADNAKKYFTTKDINTLDTTNGYITSFEPLVGKQAKVSLLQGEIVSEKDFKDLAQYTNNYKNPVEISVDVGAIANADGGKIRSGDLINITMMFSREQLRYTTSIDTVSQTNGSGTLLSIPEFNLSTGTYEDTSEDETAVDDAEASTAEETPVKEEISTDIAEPIEIKTPGDYFFEYYAKYVLQDIYVVKALDSAGTEIPSTDTESTASILVFVIDKSDESDVNNALANCSNIRISKVVDSAQIAEESGYSGVEESEPEEQTTAEKIAEDAMRELSDETQETEELGE